MSVAGRRGNTYSMSYEDTGCEFAPSCLNCPFPNCIESELIRRRRTQIRVMKRQGKSLEEIATELNVTVADARWGKGEQHKAFQEVAGA